MTRMSRKARAPPHPPPIAGTSRHRAPPLCEGKQSDRPASPFKVCRAA